MIYTRNIDDVDLLMKKLMPIAAAANIAFEKRFNDTSQTDTGHISFSAEKWPIHSFQIFFHTGKIRFFDFSQFPRFPFLVWENGKRLR